VDQRFDVFLSQYDDDKIGELSEEVTPLSLPLASLSLPLASLSLPLSPLSAPPSRVVLRSRVFGTWFGVEAVFIAVVQASGSMSSCRSTTMTRSANSRKRSVTALGLNSRAMPRALWWF